MPRRARSRRPHQIPVPRHPHLARGLLAASADVSARDTKTGQTVLMVAAEGGHEQVALALLQAGGDVGARDCTGQTALLHAARNGHEPCLRALLEAHADVNTQCIYGWTALFYAARYGREQIALVPLPSAAACKLLYAGGQLRGAPKEARDARIEQQIGLPFRMAYPAEGLLLSGGLSRDAVMARKTIANLAQQQEIGCALVQCLYVPPPRASALYYEAGEERVRLPAP